jgi:hypothetical protein
LFAEPERERELTVFSSIPVPPDAEIKGCTLSDVLFMDRVNDLSFTVGNRVLMFFEHQSTLSDNFPLRYLLYCGRVYEQIIANEAIYHHKLIKIPTPEFIVLYNGIEPFPNTSGKKIYKLSDAFAIAPETMPLELIVTAYDINDGKSSELLGKCKTLREYSVFIAKIRELQNSGTPREIAVKNAVKHCINNNVLAEYLQEKGSEVCNMLLQEWNWDLAEKVWREEAREDGLQEGRQEGLIQAAINMLRNKLPVTTVVDCTGIPESEIRQYAQQHGLPIPQ